MKIYTKTGDKGTTSLYGGTKVSKHHIRIETYGTVDELNASIGCVLSENLPDETEQQLTHIQKVLFTLGAELATPEDKLFLANGKSRLPKTIQESHITELEEWIDETEKSLPQLTAFILPGGNKASSFLHLSRTVCRRAERLTVALSEVENIREDLIIYLNRLSDYLFVAARYVNQKQNGKPEVNWLPNE